MFMQKDKTERGNLHGVSEQVLDSLGVGSAGPQSALAGGTSIHVASGAVQVSVPAAPGCTVAEAQRAGDTAAKAFMERLIREKRAL